MIRGDEYCFFNLQKVVQVLNYFVLIMAAGHLLKELLSLFSKVRINCSRKFCVVTFRYFDNLNNLLLVLSQVSKVTS